MSNIVTFSFINCQTLLFFMNYQIVLIFSQKCTSKLTFKNYLKFLYRKQLCALSDVFLFSVSEQVSRSVVGNKSRIMATYLTFGFVASLLRISNFFQVFVFEILRNLRARFLILCSHYMIIFHNDYFVIWMIFSKNIN